MKSTVFVSIVLFIFFFLGYQPSSSLAVAAAAKSSPQPPVFPDSFVWSYSGVSDEGSYFGTTWWDYANLRSRQDSWDTSNSTHSISFIDRYDRIPTQGNEQDFTFCSWVPICIIMYLVPPMRPMGVPSDSRFLGTEVISGRKCDHWKYEWKSQSHDWITDYFVASSMDGDEKYEYPVKIVYSGNQPPCTVVTTQFHRNSSILESEFEVPSTWSCTQGTEVVKENHLRHFRERLFGIAFASVDEQKCPVPV